MNIRDEILLEHSKVQSQKIADWIGDNPDRFNALIQLFLHDEYRVIQRAAWIISLVAKKYPHLILPFLEPMVSQMTAAGQHPAVRRNIVRILDLIPEIPEPLHGPVLNACFDFIADPKEAIAVRAFSLTVLGKLARQYPDITPELKAIIEDLLRQEPAPALIVRAKRVLNTLKISL